MYDKTGCDLRGWEARGFYISPVWYRARPVCWRHDLCSPSLRRSTYIAWAGTCEGGGGMDRGLATEQLCTSGTCAFARVTFGLGGVAGDRGGVAVHSPFGTQGEQGYGYGGTKCPPRKLGPCWRPHGNEPPSVVEVQPPPPHSTHHTTPRPKHHPVRFLCWCGWVDRGRAASDKHRRRHLFLEGLVRAVNRECAFQ